MHTPGPWKAFDENGHHVQADAWDIDREGAGSLSYAPIKAGNVVVAFAVSHSLRSSASHDVAPNCRLIAAAPELLAFARQLASCEIPEAVDYAEEARRLVDQAEGGAA